MKLQVRRAVWVLFSLLPASVVEGIRGRIYLSALRRRPDAAAEPELVVVEALVDEGDRCVDIGANLGLYSVVLARLVGERGTVYSFEPVPSTFSLLARNLQRLGLGHVRTFPRAIGNADSELTMSVPKWNYGAPNYYVAHVTDKPEGGEESFTVRGSRLDTVLEESASGAITFVKCDVEGHELAVLEGAAALLRRDRPAWLIEVSGDPDDPGSNASRLVALMAAAGYGTYRFDGRTVVARTAGDQSINYLFLQPAHVQRLQSRRLA